MEDRQQRNRRRFTAEFKGDAVELVGTSGRPIAEIARKLGIYDSTLGNWVRQDRIDRGEQDGLTSDEQTRLRELEGENTRLGMERELRKRTVAFWVKENALAGRLWSRTTIYVYRALAQLAGLTEGELRRLVRMSFAKVAEYQKRGAVHFHAIIRLDAATDRACPPCVAPPPAGFTAELLEAAVRKAAEAVTVPCPVVDEDEGVTLTARWGEQLDVRHITEAGDDGELSAEQVASYVAKYATKSTEALGVTLDQRVGEVELEGLNVPAHVAELVRASWKLGAHPSLASLRLRKWAHMLGFGGHFSTKSRRYSTTLGALRRARVTYAIRRRKGNTLPLDAWGRPEDDQAVIVVASWAYLGSGYQSTGEAWRAASAAARAREARRIAREELRTTPRVA